VPPRFRPAQIRKVEWLELWVARTMDGDGCLPASKIQTFWYRRGGFEST